MNKLFYVNLYNQKDNSIAHILVSTENSKDDEYVKNNALESVGKGWRVQDVVFICNTPDNVDTEL